MSNFTRLIKEHAEGADSLCYSSTVAPQYNMAKLRHSSCLFVRASSRVPDLISSRASEKLTLNSASDLISFRVSEKLNSAFQVIML